MNKLFFMNEGYFDTLAMLTFGVSAKKHNNAIGFFGTGFKYAIAIILRQGGTIKIITRTDDGVDEITNFTKVTKRIGGQDFDVVQCNGQDAGFTTRLGLQWEPWMAYRELRCNCTDEKGVISTELDMDYQTVVAIDCPIILSCHENRAHYFIEGTPIHQTDSVEVYEGSRPFHYYRGVAVQAAPESEFSYNVISRVELSEERTVKYSWEISNRVQAAIQNMACPEVVRRIVRSAHKFDASLGFDTISPVSETFRQEVFEAMKTGTLKNEAARKVLETLAHEKAEYEIKTLNRAEMEQLGRALRFLMHIDIPVRDFPICPVVNLGKGVMGRALNGKIYVSEMAFMMGTKQLASTLMEEWVHLRHECHDFDRAMQNWLFDKILSLAENFNGKPL